jgi:hypothetical protein
MLSDAIYLEPKNAEKIVCTICDFICSKRSNYEKHLLTLKHKNAIKCYENAIYLEPKNAVCDFCEKSFKHLSSMYRHKKICKKNYENKEPSKDDIITNDKLVEYLMKENSELKQIIIEVCKNVNVSNNNTTNNNNSHNKTFNLNFFLNETCKDAMNIMDFVDSIKLQLSDLESVGKLGFVEGISNIITNNLKALDVTQRPVHCTDNKREVLYVKHEDKWEKEDEQKKKMRKAIKKVATKNMCLIPKFKEAHPDCSKSSSYYSDQYNKIIVEACGGSGDNDLEKEDKIIRKIANNVIIDKQNI